MTLKAIIRYPGFKLYLIFILIGIPVLIFMNKGDLVIWINHNLTPYGDLFFKYCTHLGDGATFALLLVVFLFRSYYFSVISAIAIIVQTIIVQGLKRIIFYGMPRPLLFFPNFEELHVVEGVTIVGPHTFPSGHTATAFTMAVILSFYVKNKNWSWVFFLVAILVGVSRMYLLQHFFIDIYMGSIIGTITGTFLIVFFENTGLKNKESLNKGILKHR